MIHDAAMILVSLTIVDKPALVEVKHTAGPLGGQRVVRDHHDGLLEFPVELVHQVEDLAGGHAIEIAGRLVGNQEVGVGDDRPGDRHALFLAAGELAGIVVLASLKADDPQAPSSHFHAACASKMGQEERQFDVFQSGQDGDQVVCLEDEADVVGPPASDLGLAKSPRS